MEASCCAVDSGVCFGCPFVGVFAVVFGVAAFCFGIVCFGIGLGCVQERLQFVYRRPQIFRAAEHLRNVHHTASI